MNVKLEKSIFNEIDPFVYKGVNYKSISQAYYASSITDKDALAVFLNSPLEPHKTFIMIKEEFKSYEFENILNIMRARFLKDEASIKRLLKTKTRDKWINLLINEMKDYQFSQQELF